MKRVFTMRNVLRPETDGFSKIIRSRSRRINKVTCHRIAVRYGLTGKPRKIEAGPPVKKDML